MTRAREKLPTVDPREIDRPHGRYTVELFDDLTGRCRERIVRDNYITPLFEKHIAGLQYTNQWFSIPLPHSGSLVDQSSTSTGPLHNVWSDRIWNPMHVSPLPMDSLILTNDSRAEDPDDHWLRGMVVASAKRWKETVSASGPTGLINESESGFSNNGNTHKTVWDFTTQQGNGTFQTLAIGGMSSNDYLQWCGLGPQAVIHGDTLNSWSFTDWSTGTVMPAIRSCPHLVDGVVYWVMPDTALQSSALGIYSLPLDDFLGITKGAYPNDELAMDATGATPTRVCGVGLSMNNVGGTTSPGSGMMFGLARMGPTGDFLFAWTGTTTGSLTIRVLRRTPGDSTVWSTTVGVSSAQMATTSNQANGTRIGLVYDGTHAYVGSGSGDIDFAKNLYRIDPADGSTTATIPLPTWQGNQITASGDMTMHQGDIMLQSWGLIRVTTAGSLVAAYGLPGTRTMYTRTAVSPWPTTTNLYGPVGRSNIAWTPVYAGFRSRPATSVQPNIYAITQTPNADNLAFAYQRGLFSDGSRMWTIVPNLVAAAGQGGGMLAITGANCFSKTVLDSPVTKTSSQNMKISYELTWPSGNVLDRVHDHPLIG